MALPVEQIISTLGLKSHPTCGFAAVSYQSSLAIPREAKSISSNADRALASALYFLVKVDTRTKMHRIPSDQLYHHYSGDPLEVILLHADGKGEVRVLGADLANGMRPQLLVPGSTFHMSRLKAPFRAGYALMGTTAWPDVEKADLELGNMQALMSSHLGFRDKILDFMGPAQPIS